MRCTARFVKVRLVVMKAKDIFTKYRITLEQTRKPYQIGLLLKHNNDHFGTISVTERSCSALILKLVEIGFCHGHSSPACEPAFGPKQKKISRSGGRREEGMIQSQITCKKARIWTLF